METEKVHEKDHNVNVRRFSGAKVKRMENYVKPCICEQSLDWPNG